MPYDQRRQSIGVAANFVAPRETFTPHSTNSSFYTPTSGVLQRPPNYFPGYATLSISSNFPSMYLFNNGNLPVSPKNSIIGQPPIFNNRKGSIIPQNFGPTQNCPPARENRKKAVITVDAQTTEILIANDSVCRLFSLKDRSLIGRKLKDVFAGKGVDELKQLNHSSFYCDDPDEGSKPIIVNNALFSQNGKLTPVYGKPVDIIDADGVLSTVCVWSYPLTPAAALATQRKNSALLSRSPSERIPASILSDLKKPNEKPHNNVVFRNSVFN
uniref:PAS domain-containing protein n=1 Tax=Panagrolaimus davidi TaxID=227884 RepID=A0A914QZB8_9BILA